MIILNQLKMPCGTDPSCLKEKVLHRLRLAQGEIEDVKILRHSIDARKKPVLFDTYSVGVCLKKGTAREEATVNRLHDRNILFRIPLSYELPEALNGSALSASPVIVGSGPAGLFAALVLAQCGARPVILERGLSMEERTKKVESFFAGGPLDPDCNIQFGEGGAGTYSDGKLTTNVKDKVGRTEYILQAFIGAGADPSIAYEFHPHIGTDALRKVVVNLRHRIEDLGGSFRFGTKMTDVLMSGNRVTGVRCEKNGESFDLPCSVLILAIGHSARDTIRMLRARKIPMQEKNFAVGMRISHPQSSINFCQYGISDEKELQKLHLEAASYKLTHQTASGHGVYSFCMCPGGYVVNASSERGRLAVNGMSDFARDSRRANAAIVVTVGPETFREVVPCPDDPVLSGLYFQEALEEKAYRIADGRIPVESFPDYAEKARVERRDLSDEEAEDLCIKGKASMADLSDLLPKTITADLVEGMYAFGKVMPGFDGTDACFMGLESRTSSPVRIPRDADYIAQDPGSGDRIEGLYPCGEGAGYAGGIMSAALDGMKCAERVLSALRSC